MSTIALPISPPFAAPPVQAAPAVSPLSPEHLAELAAAKLRQKKLRRAQGVATADAWLTSIFAAFTLLSGIFDPAGALLGLVMAFVAFNSFRGVRLFKRLDPRGPTLLGRNQLLLAAAITLYALWCIYVALAAPPQLGEGMNDPMVAEAMKPFDSLIRNVTLIVYSGVIAATLLVQGLTSLYYFSRRKHLAAYLASTPTWIHDLQRAQAN